MGRTYQIAVIAGDGVGPEVVREGLRVLDALHAIDGFAYKTTMYPFGAEHYLKTRELMPASALQELQQFDAIYLGAIGAPTVPDHVAVWDLILPIRQRFDQYVNLRPMRLLPGIVSPFSISLR